MNHPEPENKPFIDKPFMEGKASNNIKEDIGESLESVTSLAGLLELAADILKDLDG